MDMWSTHTTAAIDRDVLVTPALMQEKWSYLQGNFQTFAERIIFILLINESKSNIFKLISYTVGTLKILIGKKNWL